MATLWNDIRIVIQRLKNVEKIANLGAATADIASLKNRLSRGPRW